MRTHVDVVIVGRGQAGLSVSGELKLAPDLWEKLAGNDGTKPHL